LVESPKSQYELYKCLLRRILQRLKDGKVEEEFYPFAGRVNRIRVNKVVIYYVGGCTYEEMRVAEDFSSDGFEVIVGGDTVHNASSFLKEEVLPFC
jgi:hypothetical protein